MDNSSEVVFAKIFARGQAMGEHDMNAKMEYRPDIDGLRAMAVLAVILYHAGITTFAGGFIGVDVFFVISGFLITAQIVKEIRANEFSIISFYERRIRRIFPAFFVVVLFILLIGAWLFDSETYKEVGTSAVAATFSVSNIFFWSQAGYFDAPSSLKPLLHAWSLSVEEQFYFVLPILLLLIHRFFKSRFVLALILVIGLSFGLSVAVLNQDPNSAFYLAHLRAWELLVGSLIALRPIKLKPWVQEILSLLGLGMIAASALVYSDLTLFPGAAALLPVLGSGLIINSGVFAKTVIGKILSAPPFVFIGKISYSLYLWHWPLIVFARYYLIRDLTNLQIILWMVVTLILSVLSWRFIEIPFRSKKFLPRPRIFIFAGSMMALIIGLGYSIDLTQGFPARFAKGSVLNISDWNAEWKTWEKCTYAEKDEQKLNFCKAGKDSQTTDFLMFGDSHSRALAPGINRAASQAGVSGLVIYRNGCAPLLGIGHPGENNGCFQYNNLVFDYIKTHPEIKTIIISARWSVYVKRAGTGSGAKWVDRLAANKDDKDATLFEIGLYRTIDELLKLNRQVFIVSPIPEIAYNVPSAFSIARRTGRDINNIIAPSFVEYNQKNTLVFAVFEKIKEKYTSAQFIDLTDRFCNAQKCLVVIDGKPLYLDNDHLSTFGAYYVSNKFDPVFAALRIK